MSFIMLFMQRKAIVQALDNRLENNLDVSLIYEENYPDAINIICINKATVALIEAAESGLYNMSYCLNLCKEIRKQNPKCKLLLMCSEQNQDCVKFVVEAKGKGQIDDFIFYDVSIEYLSSKLISI